MRVRVKYFAALREAIGRAEEQVDLPREALTVAELRSHLEASGAGALGELRNLRAAVNQAMAQPDTPVADGDEVAFFPPVTGG